MEKEIWNLSEWACKSWSSFFGLGLEFGLCHDELCYIETPGNSLRRMLSEMLKLAYTKDPDSFFTRLYRGMRTQQLEGIYSRYILRNKLVDPFLTSCGQEDQDESCICFDDDMQTCRILLRIAQGLTYCPSLAPLLLVLMDIEPLKEMPDKLERLYRILIAGYNKFPYLTFRRLVKKCIIECELSTSYNFHLDQLVDMPVEMKNMWVIDSVNRKYVVEKDLPEDVRICEEFEMVDINDDVPE